jgi:glycerol-3-phosphate O-acyltransferase
MGPILRWVASRYFQPVRFSPDAQTQLHELSERGFVVHVMRTTSWVNYLYLAWALVQRGLPPVRAVVNLRRWLTRPWRLTASRGSPEVRFTYARRHSGSALVFLKSSALARPQGKDSPEDAFPSLVALARRSDRPVFLVPELFAWEKWSVRLKPGLMDRVFGSPEAPGFIHSVLSFWRNHQRAQFRMGKPLDLSAFLAEHESESDARIARKVRSILSVHLGRETRAVFGPPFKHADRVMDETLRDRTLRKTLQDLATELSRPIETVLREARTHLESIAARLHPTVVGLAAPFLQWIFHRIYDGIEVDEAGLERAMQTASQAPIVLCPSHKSHIDYLVLSWVLWKRGYTVPHVAAGANLSFFPLGIFLRRGGAFFLRRSFKEDRLYTAVFKAYLKKLVRDRVLQEFFPEGSRSRTGKLLPPKLGMLTWEVDAVLEGASDDLVFVPVAIDYERVVESQSYSHELSGGEKKPEDLRALLGARKVLTAKYGRIHLGFSAPLSLAEFAKSRGVELTPQLPEPDKKSLVRALGNRIMYGISQVSTVTPQSLVSAALLTTSRGTVKARVLSDRIQLLRYLAADAGVPLSPVLNNAPSDPTVLGPIQEAVRGFADEGMVRIDRHGETNAYEAEPAARLQLAFYKNTVMNLVAPRSLVANALRAGNDRSVDAVRKRALMLSRLFKLEFIYRVGMGFDTLFAQNVEALTRWGVLLPATHELTLAPESHSRPTLEFLSALLDDYLEAYWVAILALRETPMQTPVDKRQWLRTAFDLGRSLLSRGKIRLPEAISRPMLENALAFFVDQQLLVEEGRSVRRPEGSQTAVATWVESLKEYVGS